MPGSPCRTRVRRLRASPWRLKRSRLSPGKTVQLTAQGAYADGSTRDITAQATWTSSDPSRVTVTASGVVTGIAGGDASVTAALNGFSATANAHVFVANPSPTPPLSQSVAFQIDYAHSGRATVGASGPTFPPTANWSMTLNGPVSYPIIAGGLVIVTTGTNATDPTAYGTSIYALSLTTGAIVWGPDYHSGYVRVLCGGVRSRHGIRREFRWNGSSHRCGDRFVTVDRDAAVAR